MQTDRDKVIFDMGYKPTLDDVTNTYDIEAVISTNQGFGLQCDYCNDSDS